MSVLTGFWRVASSLGGMSEETLPEIFGGRIEIMKSRLANGVIRNVALLR